MKQRGAKVDGRFIALVRSTAVVVDTNVVQKQRTLVRVTQGVPAWMVHTPPGTAVCPYTCPFKVASQQ